MTNQHPNATTAAVSGFGGGELVVEIADRLGVHLTAPAGAAVAAGCAVVALFIGRKGIRGLIRLIWAGSDDDPAKRTAA